MLRSPLRWLGGKFLLRERILKCFPEHECYVEVFSGAAWVLFGKPPETSKAEVLNDLDGELVNFWRVVKHRAAEFTEAASWLLASEDLFHEWRPLAGIGGEVSRAVKFYAVLRLGFGARRMSPSFGAKATKRPEIYWPTVREEVKKVVARLRQVWIRRMTWEQCLQFHDRPRTFFYLDPPYRAPGAKAYRHWFTDEDHAKLADALMGKVRGRWLLSYNDDPFIRQLYRGRTRNGARVHVIEVPFTYSAPRRARLRGVELLLANYPLPGDVSA